MTLSVKSTVITLLNAVLLLTSIGTNNAQTTYEPETNSTETTTESITNNSTSCYRPPWPPSEPNNSSYLCVEDSRRPSCQRCESYYVCQNNTYVEFVCDNRNHFSDVYLICMTPAMARCRLNATTSTTSIRPTTTISTHWPTNGTTHWPTTGTTPRPTTRTTPRPTTRTTTKRRPRIMSETNTN